MKLPVFIKFLLHLNFFKLTEKINSGFLAVPTPLQGVPKVTVHLII